MDIYSRPGSKVVFSHPDAGHPADQEFASAYLEIGKVYTVAKTVVHNWETDVYLKECPGRPFNSAHFDDVKEPTTQTILDAG